MKPLVSIIVNTKNEAANLPRLLGSIKDQTYPKIETLVVDNHSSDQTKKIAQKFKARFYTRGPERSPQKNYGAKKAKGDLLFFVDADMSLESRLVEEIVRIMSTQPRVGALIVSEQSVGEGFWSQARALERKCYLGDDEIEAARVFRPEVFTKVGGYDEVMISFEDWDLTDRVRAQGVSIKRTKRFLIHHEGELVLIPYLKKKIYYGRRGQPYLAKTKKMPFSWSRQTPFRACFWHKRRLLLRHPIKTAGFFTLKALEFMAGGWGHLTGRLTPVR